MFNKKAILESEAQRKLNEYKAVHQKVYRKDEEIRELDRENDKLFDKYKYYKRSKLDCASKLDNARLSEGELQE